MAIGDTPDEARAEALRIMPDDADVNALTIEQIEG